MSIRTKKRTAKATAARKRIWELVTLLRHYASLHGWTLEQALDDAITKHEFWGK